MENIFGTFSFIEIIILSNIFLVGLLFFKETLLKWIGARLRLKNGEVDDVPRWVRDLQTHFNEEITSQLKDIHSSLLELRDCMKSINNKLDAIKEFGVKIRN